MPLIKRSCLDHIRQQASLADVVSTYVQLKPAGHSLKGLSPFSNEKTPSFFVDPQKNVFKCFSSGYAGDVFRFLELKENLSFYEAVEWLAERFNIPIEYETEAKKQAQPIDSSRKTLFSIYETAEIYFKTIFWQKTSSFSQKARDYWQKERKFSLESAKTFSIGLSPTENDLAYKHLLNKGFPPQALLTSGLFYQPKTQTTQPFLVSRFQGRLMFPIKDVQGRTVAFSGRQLPFVDSPKDPTREAKYVNSPETPIFTKGNLLFNLDLARQNNDACGLFLLVEGPLDVIRCWECGLKTAVAPQGTGITEHQLKLLQRYATPVIGLLDGDKAGLRAGLRFIELGLTMGLDLRCLILEDGNDPDTYFLKNPHEASLELLKTKFISPVEFTVRAFNRLEASSEKANRLALEAVFLFLTKCGSALTQHESLRQLSAELGLSLRALEEDFQRLLKSSLRRQETKQPEKTLVLPEAKNSLEGQLLLLLFHHSELTQGILAALSTDWVDEQSLLGQLLAKIVQEFKENGIEPLNSTEGWHLSDNEKEIWYQLMAEQSGFDNAQQAAEVCLQQMYKKFLKNCISTIDKQMAKRSNISLDKIKQLQMRRHQLKKALATSNPIRLNEQSKVEL